MRAGIEAIAARLTRFDPASELCALNADPRTEVPASPLLRRAVQAALLGARRTGGLADPTLLDAVEAAGYERSRIGVEPASLDDALRAAPPRRPATPGTRWRAVEVRDGVDRAPAGPASSTSAAARRGSRRTGRPRGCAGATWSTAAATSASAAPTTSRCAAPRTRCASPTAPSRRRASTAASGGAPTARYAHHLLDPGTGEPAWTGLISATAVAPTAMEAEALAKAALLAGPRGARRSRRPRGIVVHDDGRSEAVETLRLAA